MVRWILEFPRGGWTIRILPLVSGYVLRVTSPAGVETMQRHGCASVSEAVESAVTHLAGTGIAMGEQEMKAIAEAIDGRP